MTRPGRIGLCALTLLLATAPPAPAAVDNAGTTAGNFLSVGSGAGVLGMGGATLALPGGLPTAAWNPAALGLLDETEFALAHAGLEGGAAQEWAAVGGRLARTPTRWSISGLYHGQGSFEGRDALGNPTGSFEVSDLALGANLAHAIGEFVTVGLGAKYVSENLGTTTGNGLTFDGGVMVRTGMLGFGLAAQNLGGHMRYDGASYPFPSNIGMGVGLEHPTGLRVALDANFPKAYYNDVRAGVEWRWKDRLALRAGYRTELSAPSDERLSGPSFGLGGGVGGMWIDYGYIVPGQGDGQHRFGITFRPGAMRAGFGALGANETPSSEKAGRAGETALETSPPSWRAPKSEPQAPRAAALPPADPKKAAPKADAGAKPVEPGKAPSASGSSSTAPAAKLAPAPESEKPAPLTSPASTAPAKTSATTGGATAKASPAAQLAAPAKPAPAVTTPPAKPAPAAAAPTKRAPAVTAPAKPTPSAPEAAMKQAVALGPSAPAPRGVESATPALPAPATVEAPKPVALQTPSPGEPAATAKAPAVLQPARPAPTPAPAKSASSAPVQRPDKVKVKAGETLADIAKQWGTSVAAIMMENNMVTERVKPGQVVRLPKK